MALILGIESSCDETAAAVVRDGEQVLSNVVSSQIATHQLYGGVVPELASREHLRAIVPVVREAISRANLTFKDIDAFAVTQGPGLAGALLVGITYAKTLAFALSKPLISVNHLEGHIHAVLLEQRETQSEQPLLPALALVVSGGHTHLYVVDRTGFGWTYKNVGRTLDDAAGEAFDKVAKLLGLGYPGGPLVEALAAHGDARAVSFPRSQIKIGQKRHARGEQSEVDENFDFSFSGIKTAVLRYVETHAMQASIDARRRTLQSVANPTADDYRANSNQATLDLLASFQEAVVQDLAGKTLRAAEAFRVQSIIVTGGVAANARLRAEFQRRSAREGLQAFFPSRKLSTDNAAMIAAAAYPKFLAGDFADPHFCAEASLALGTSSKS
jgi:N6-L-threonylcarbamoyladenine synthase